MCVCISCKTEWKHYFVKNSLQYRRSQELTLCSCLVQVFGSRRFRALICIQYRGKLLKIWLHCASKFCRTIFLQSLLFVFSFLLAKAFFDLCVNCSLIFFASFYHAVKLKVIEISIQ